jgi:hypothetical protein
MGGGGRKHQNDKNKVGRNEECKRKEKKSQRGRNSRR